MTEAETKPTALAAWRDRLGLTHRQAAEALGITLVAYQVLERERNFDSKGGGEVKVDLRTKLAAAAIEAGLDPVSR